MEQPIEKSPEQSRKLADTVSYRDGTITNRSIIDSKNAKVTLHAFAQGQGMSDHIAQFESMVYIIDGEAVVIISNKTNHLNSGDYMLIPGNAHFALMAIKPFKVLMVVLKS